MKREVFFITCTDDEGMTMHYSTLEGVGGVWFYSFGLAQFFGLLTDAMEIKDNLVIGGMRGVEIKKLSGEVS